MFHNNKSLKDLCGTSREFMVSLLYMCILPKSPWTEECEWAELSDVFRLEVNHLFDSMS